MKLYGVDISPYASKVRIALRLKDLAFDQVPPPEGYRSDAYRRLVPTGTLPALDLGNTVLVESNAIIEYLDETYPEPPLLPTDPLERARARAAAAYHDTRLEPVLHALFPRMVEPTLDHAAFAEAAALFAERLTRLEEQMPEAPYIAGAALSLGDLGYPWTLEAARRIFSEGDAGFAPSDRTAAWIARVAAFPAVAETLAEAGAGLDGWLAEKRAARRAAGGAG